MPVYHILFYPLLVVLSAICGPAHAADTLLVSRLQPTTPACSLKQLEWAETDRYLTYDQATRLAFAPGGTISVRSDKAYWARGLLKNDLEKDTILYFYSRKTNELNGVIEVNTQTWYFLQPGADQRDLGEMDAAIYHIRYGDGK